MTLPLICCFNDFETKMKSFSSKTFSINILEDLENFAISQNCRRSHYKSSMQKNFRTSGQSYKLKLGITKVVLSKVGHLAHVH